jgi:biopolymer transport protein ExbB/TolQ
MELDLVELWSTMGLPVKAVVIVLTIQAVAVISAVVDRLIMLAVSMARTRAFARRAAASLESGEIEKLADIAAQTKGSHLAEYLEAGLRAYVEARAKRVPLQRSTELARRALERRGELVAQDLHRRMNVLASTGSTAPFVGLLGTVLGIINAFEMIAASGSGGIGTIGAAIGEALVVTGYGLLVAIPTVLTFNWLSGKISAYETGLLTAGSEMVDRLETLEASTPSAYFDDTADEDSGVCSARVVAPAA